MIEVQASGPGLSVRRGRIGWWLMLSLGDGSKLRRVLWHRTEVGANRALARRLVAAMTGDPNY